MGNLTLAGPLELERGSMPLDVRAMSNRAERHGRPSAFVLGREALKHGSGPVPAKALAPPTNDRRASAAQAPPGNRRRPRRTTRSHSLGATQFWIAANGGRFEF